MVVLLSSMSTLFPFHKLYTIYIKSFYWIALFGLIQFCLGLLGVDILVTQWWKENLPRINAFSYEPSYYATYMFIGWYSLFHEFVFNKNRKYTWYLVVVSSSMILSSSRMGIAMMLFSAVLVYLINILNLFFRKGIIKMRMLRMVGFMGIVLAILTSYTVVNFEKYKFLFNGLGFGGIASYSTEGRLERGMEVLDIFLDNPYIGVGLGGIPSAIAENRGIIITDNFIAKKGFEGQNAILEVLAASGVIGFIFFIMYIYKIIYLGIRCSSMIKTLSPVDSIRGKGLTFGFIFLILLLMMNQNILRPYFWIHIGMVSLAIISNKNKYKNEFI